MKQFFVAIALILSFALAAPVAHADLDQQRRDVFQELGTVRAEIRTELQAKIAEFQSSLGNPQERALLEQQILNLRGRFRAIGTFRQDALYRYNETQLDMLIVRYDLPVSQS